MASKNNQMDRCKACGQPVAGNIRPNEQGELFCRQCAMAQLEQDLLQSTATEPSKQRRSSKSWRIAIIVFVILAAGIIAYQSPKLLMIFKDPKPVRMGTYETDEITDKCIRNLWQQVYLMQQGRADDTRHVVCPATGKPYVFVRGTNQEVHCPNPDRHGFRDIVVTKKNPVPELKR